METPEQWPKIKEILGVAIELAPAERAAYLDAACAGDPELREEVVSLIAVHADAGGLLESSFAASTAVDPVCDAKTVGPYRLIHVLGVGGMGQVWLAEQTEPVHRRVALKLIRAGMYDDALVKRFQSERQSLAIMEHPAIAKVFDAGGTPEGQPYFAMEYVDGPPITDYCDCKKLGLRERLKLFTQVCDGVQHAHQKAIVHRDLKPSNILVAEVDGKPVPRIIDFGLAKTTVPHALGETMYTHVGGFLGTPGYMSPEQADASVQDVDTRTDVYSLGVVLYELLTGSLPFDATRWKKQRLDEVLRELRGQDPPKPSTKVSTSRDTSTAQADARNTQPRELISALRGDLDCITMKALEKERERRYGTPFELVADIERYLQNRPIVARPASTSYRLRKYVRRNRAGVAVAAGAAVLLIAFAAMQTIQLHRITRERDRADRVTEFMTNMFKVSDPSEARGKSIRVTEILDKASKDIESGLSNDPQMQAQLMSVMGDVYHRLGLYSKAETLLRRALDTERGILGLENQETLSTTSRLAGALADAGKLAEAEKLLWPLVESEKKRLGLENQKTLVAMNLLASTLHGQGRFAEAEKMYREAMETQRRVFGPEDRITLVLMSNVAAVLMDSGSRSPEIVDLNRQILEARRRLLGPDHPDTLQSMSNLGIALTALGNHTTEAEKLLKETWDIQNRVFGPEHPETLGTMLALTSVFEQQYRYQDEEKLARKTLEIELRVLGPEHTDTAAAMATLAGALALQKRYQEAEDANLRALDVESRILPPDHPTVLQTKTNLADVLESEGRFLEAKTLVLEVIGTGERVLGSEHPITLQATYVLGEVRKDEGQLEEADKVLHQTRDVAFRVLSQGNLITALCTYALARVAALRNRHSEATLLLEEALDHGLDPPTAQAIGKEQDFKFLQSDPKFEAILLRIDRPGNHGKGRAQGKN